MKKILLVFTLFAICSFIFPQKIEAARSLSIMSDKLSLFGDEEMLITASPSGFASSEAILIKGAFYQDGSTNYFGYTKKGDIWIKNGDPTVNQLSINTGNWDGTIRVKTDFLDGGYKGEGDYKFKVGFYYTTSNGNLSSVNWSTNILTITINEPDPTPTPTPTTAPTATPTPVPTPTKAPTPVPTKSPTLKPTPSPEPQVLAESTIEPTSEPTPEPIPTSKPPILAFVFIGLGLVLICVSILYTIRHATKNPLPN